MNEYQQAVLARLDRIAVTLDRGAAAPLWPWPRAKTGALEGGMKRATEREYARLGRLLAERRAAPVETGCEPPTWAEHAAHPS